MVLQSHSGTFCLSENTVKKKQRPHILQIAEHRNYHYLFIIIIRIQVAPPITPNLLGRYEDFL
jgi:hypothetical protein